MNQNVVNGRPNPVNKSGLWSRFRIVTILCIIVLMIAGSYLNSRRISYLLYYLNWYHWPRWYSINLWILALGAAVNCFVQRKNVRIILYVGILGTISIVTALNSTWLHIMVHRTFCLFKVIYYSVFRPYFYAPFVELFSNGTVTARLFIAPVSALGLVTLILVCRYVIRRSLKNKQPQF